MDVMIEETVWPSAAHVLEKCGGVARVAEICGRHRSWVHRWTYPRRRGGTGGAVPHEDAVKLLKAAVVSDIPFPFKKARHHEGAGQLVQQGGNGGVRRPRRSPGQRTSGERVPGLRNSHTP